MSGQTVTNYATLEQAIQDWLSRSDITDTNYAPEILQMAQARLYRGFTNNKGEYVPGMRVHEMETPFAAVGDAAPTIPAGGLVAVPSGYLDLKYMYVVDSGGVLQPLTRKPVQWLYANYGNQTAVGVPAYVARDGTNFVFGPFPDSEYSYNGVYYWQDQPLSDSYPSNFLTTAYPDVLLAASLAETSAFIQDQSQLQYWEAKLSGLLGVIRQRERDEALSGSPIAMAPG